MEMVSKLFFRDINNIPGLVASQVPNISNLSINSTTQGSGNDDDDNTQQEKSPIASELSNDDEDSIKPTNVDNYDIQYSNNGNAENEDYDGENTSANGLFDVNDLQCVIEEPVTDTNIIDNNNVKQFNSTNSLPTSDISDDNPFDEIRRIATENVTLRRKNRVAKYISDIDLGLFDDDSSQDVAKLLENVENASNTPKPLKTGNDENGKFQIVKQTDVSNDSHETME